MVQVLAVHQATQRAPEWLRIRQHHEDCTVTTVPLDNPVQQSTSTFGTRIISGEDFLPSLNDRLLREPASFEVAWDGGHTAVHSVPLPGVRALQVESDKGVAILALAPSQQSAAVVDPVSVVAIMAIVTIVAIVAITTTAIVVISESGDDGEGRGEVEVKPDPQPSDETHRQTEETNKG